MANKEFYLQLFIIETFKENGTKFLNAETQEDETKETVKRYLKNEIFREKIIDEFTDVIYKNFGIK